PNSVSIFTALLLSLARFAVYAVNHPTSSCLAQFAVTSNSPLRPGVRGGAPAPRRLMDESSEIRQASLREIALVFLKLGTIAFGGPAAHLAMMEEEFVRRRRWITQAEFLDRIATANLIPGPSSTEVAIFVGQLKRGWRGLIVAGCCFLIPAAIIVTAIAWAYVRFGSLPKVEGVLSAIKPVVVAIVIQALGKLGQSGVRTTLLAVIAALAAALSLAGVSPVLVLVFAGAVSAAARAMKNRLLGAGVGLQNVAGLQKVIGLPKVVAATIAGT